MLEATASNKINSYTSHFIRPEGILLIVLLVVAFLPVLLVDIPAMADYPNHLARMSILMRAGTPEAHPYYEAAWAPYPNLAMDLVVPFAGRLIGIELASKLFYLVSQMLVVSGAMAVGAAAQGRVILSGFVASLFLYAMPFAFGFVNFEFGLGIVLWSIAVWIWLAERPLPLRLAIHAVFVVVLYISHLFALGLYGIVVGLYELSRWPDHIENWKRTILLVAGMAAPVVAVGALALAYGGKVGGEGTEWALSAKLLALVQVNGFSRYTSSAVTVVLVILSYLAVKHRMVAVSRVGCWIGFGLLCLFILMPFRVADTAFVDGRVLLALVLILPAFVTIKRPQGSRGTLLVALAFGAGLANSGIAIWAQLSCRGEYRALMTAFDAIPMGSRILTGQNGLPDDPPTNLLLYPMYNAAALAVVTRNALMPTLFTYPGKQPVRPRPEVANLTVPQGGPIPMSELEAYAAGALPPVEAAYAAHWTRDFDYLLVIAPERSPPRHGNLELIAEGKQFKFYRIRKLVDADRKSG
ncbi:hypothetical protein EOA22_09615 [Mesorhizobium sp. M7A.F.Ca.US.014.04.1.1]|uniref:hypothetical protein n=1 Tax=Mesorhizobium TaxID=68287 RepID=UPI0007A95BBF|nr:MULTISPECIES: hypothetical protein [Mesorhizobium]AMX94442.1 hypothetical protein A4R28_15810 [Mesorhizobium ciceri]MDF3209240.1 hypothetical protein [Mesorhizobium sp. LMG15046]MDF3228187.1 hypothetical protein [Mesorhizobium sp. DSM 30133]RUU17426.1 hypothetical protein EOC84_24690 [Mesorhizobium sp. Primo-B]RUU40639.1 hypothetical protein EOC83_07895 [Mesorhizobium sp. Primo-A]